MRCVLKGDTFTVDLSWAAKRFTITSAADLDAALDSIRKTNPDEQDDISICMRMGACPAGLFDAFTRECWELFNAIKDGQGWPWRGGFYGQPHVFHEASRVLSNELAVIAKEDQRRNGGSGKV